MALGIVFAYLLSHMKQLINQSKAVFASWEEKTIPKNTFETNSS